MNEDLDVWGLQDVYDALAEMRAYLVQTMVVCFASVFLCETMVVANGTLGVVDPAVSRGVGLVFTVIAVASAVVALVQTANCASEIIRLEQLVAWAGGGASCVVVAPNEDTAFDLAHDYLTDGWWGEHVASSPDRVGSVIVHDLAIRRMSAERIARALTEARVSPRKRGAR